MFRRLNRNISLLIGGLLLGLGIGLAVFLSIKGNYNGLDGTKTSTREVESSQLIGYHSPEFELGTTSGDLLKLSKFTGKPVIINFWATWCGPCREEMPLLEKRYKAFQPGVEILAVNFDEEAPQVQSFIDEFGLTFPVVLDPGGKVADLYRVIGMPSTFFVDSQGVIQAVHFGSLSENLLDGYLTKIGINHD